MDRSLAIVPLVVLLTMGLVLPAASVGAVSASPDLGASATADGAGPDGVHHDERVLQAEASSGAAANNTTQHENPDELDTRDDVGDVTRWLERRLGGNLEQSSIELSRGEADLAKRLLGEEFADQFERYAYVTGQTGTNEDDQSSERFRETRETQEEFADTVQEFRETREAYEEARQNGDEGQARERARELRRLARTANRTGSALRADYRTLSNGTAADLGEASFVVRDITRNITQQQAEIVRETFVPTALTLQPASRQVSFLDPLRLTGRLAGEDGSTLAERTVRLRIGGQTLRAQTDADGEFTASYRPVLLPADEQTIAVEFVPRNESIYLGTNGSVTVSVSQVTPDLTVGQVPDAVAFDDRIDVAGRVSAEDVGAEGVPVAVRLGGVTLGTTRTNPDGTYSFGGRVPASVDDGDRALTATVALEGRALAGVDRSRPVRVDPTETALTVAGEQIDEETIRVSGTLETTGSAGVPNQEIDLVVDGDSVATARTNADGRFTERVSVPADLDPEGGNVSVTLAARFERPDSNLLDSRARTTLRLQPVANSGGGADSVAGSGSLLPVPEGIPGALAVAVAVGGLLVIIGGAIYVRRRETAGAATTGDDRATDPTDDPQSGEPSEPSTGEASPMLAGATAALDDDDRDTAVKLAFTALKRATTERLDLPDGTHWEFFVACREADLDDDRIDTLRRLTETYEQAAFSPRAVSEADARWAIDAVSAFDQPVDPSQ